MVWLELTLLKTLTITLCLYGVRDRVRLPGVTQVRVMVVERIVLWLPGYDGSGD